MVALAAQGQPGAQHCPVLQDRFRLGVQRDLIEYVLRVAGVFIEQADHGRRFDF